MLIGSLEWATATSGNLTSADRVRFLAPILRTTVQYTAGRLRMALGLLPPRVGTLDLDRLVLPDSKLADDALRECRETLTPSMQNHSLRTFVFGLALANLDGVRLDVEHLYVASLLHDIALETPTPGRCFAVVGAERALAIAQRAGAKEATARDRRGDRDAHHTRRRLRARAARADDLRWRARRPRWHAALGPRPRVRAGR